MKIKEKAQERASLVAQARKLLDTAEGEKRDLTTEENQKYEKIMADVDKMGNEIKREQNQQALEKELAGSRKEPIKPEVDSGAQESDVRIWGNRGTKEYRESFDRFLRSGVGALNAEEHRALQANDAALGGFLVTPQQLITELLKKVDDAVTIRPLATVHQLGKAESLGAPSLDTDMDDAEWTSEVKTGSEDSAMRFGKRELNPHPLAKRIKVSQKLIRVSVLNIESLIANRLAYKFGITQEKAYMTGDGAEKPLGVFIASDDGISASRDVSEDNEATTIKADGLINAKFALKGQYWKAARWIFHRDAVKQIRKLKDGNGQYLWQPGIKGNLVDTILDAPFLMSEYAPNTFTTGQYVGILGDFSFYWIADALNMVIQRLSELYAETNQVGFIGRLESDGMPVLEEAFVRVKLG